MGEVIGFEKMKSKLLKISKNDIPKENVLYQLMQFIPSFLTG